MQFKGKLKKQNSENGQKTNNFGPDIDPFWPNFGP